MKRCLWVAAAAGCLLAGVLWPTSGKTSHAATKQFLAQELFERYSSPVFEVVAVPSVPDMMLMTVQHHQDAVDSARAFAPYASSPETRAFAERIVRVQSQQIQYIKSLPEFPTDTARVLWLPMVTVCGINGATLTDQEFLSEMTLHHQRMVDMYSQWIASPQQLPQDFGMLLRSIGKGQIGEIAWMTQWRH